MRDFDVQTIDIGAPFDHVFRYVADPATLPEWTHAFRAVSDGRATLLTGRGSVDIGLEVRASREAGTVDWIMTFPDGSIGKAFSRLVGIGAGRTLYGLALRMLWHPEDARDATQEILIRIVTGRGRFR